MDKSLAPGFARTTYNGLSGLHHAITPLNIDSGAVAGSDPSVTLKDDSTLPASDAMTAYWNTLMPLFNTEQQFGLCEIYKVDAETGEGTFLYGFNLNLNGENVATAVEMAMATFSFKLTNGRLFKLVAIDAPTPVNDKLFAPYTPDGVLETISDYIVGDSSPIYGRGNAYPFAPIAYTVKTSDALRKREGLA